ncbi:MAG: hypothetical protein RLO15_11815 [Parvibaculum sp.]
MKGADFISEIERKISIPAGRKTLPERVVAERLGLSVPGLRNWKSRKKITVRQMAGLVARVEANAVKQAEKSAIKPIIEFFALDGSFSKRSKRAEIFSSRTNTGEDHAYLKGLKDELGKRRGVYIFYDSRGRALYAGKTVRQFLWNEINSAYNRARDVQKIRRVAHPKRKVIFRTSDEKQRQIYQKSVKLHELAEYLSVYEVADGLIGELESLLIRGFANDLLNSRMEKFAWTGSKRKPSKKKKFRRRAI